jgi:allantoinase
MERDFVGYGEHPPKVAWPDEARLAISIVVNYEEGAEHSLVDGTKHETTADIPSAIPAGVRDLNMESMFEYGSRVGVWRLLDILRDHSVPATFFLCGLAAERNPASASAIVERGHEASGHGYRWIEYHELDVEMQRDDIRRCVAAIRETTGQRPVGWLTRYGPTPETRELLAEEGGFMYDNMAFNDDLPYYVRVGVNRRPWLVLPYSMELNDARYWRGALVSIEGFEASLLNAFERLYAEGARYPRMMSVGLHCRISGTPSRAGVLERFLQHAKRPGVWFARRDEIARWWREHAPPAT